MVVLLVFRCHYNATFYRTNDHSVASLQQACFVRTHQCYLLDEMIYDRSILDRIIVCMFLCAVMFQLIGPVSIIFRKDNVALIKPWWVTDVLETIMFYIY